MAVCFAENMEIALFKPLISQGNTMSVAGTSKKVDKIKEKNITRG